jgi:hypothetical protein
MHIWLDIFVRELAMLVTLLALGSGPASFLGRRFDGAARLAMAPVLGLCLGTCIFTTVIWFTAARNSYWLLPVVALLSVAVALRKRWSRTARGSGDGSGRKGSEQEGSGHDGSGQERSGYEGAGRLWGQLSVRDALALALVCVVVAAPLSYTLHERHSVGPAGFEVWDAFAFTSEADGAVNDSLHAAEHKANIFGQNFAQMYWAGTASLDQNIDAVPLSANLNELMGLHSTDTQSLFMIVFLIAGALGAFAAVRYAAPRPSWAAPLAGVLFAGPFFLQLLADGSQPATCGLALILPIVVVGVDTLRRPRVASLVLLALLISGLMALYPLWVPAVAITAAIILAVLGVIAWRRGRIERRGLLQAVGGVSLVIALSIVFNIFSFLRDVRYWRQVLEGGYYIPSLPHYQLPFSVLPGWLLQTREFYFLSDLGSAPAKQVLLGVILPLLFIAVMIWGLKRRRTGLVLLALLVVYAAMGEYTSASHNCAYCTDRALLPVAPLSIGLFVLGIAALATAPRRWLRWVGVAVAIVAVVFVAQRTRQERERFANGGYFLEEGNRALLSQLPQPRGSLDIEAYGQDPGRAPGELELEYLLAFEHNHGEVSVPSEYTDYQGLAYLLNANPANPQFNPNYRYVLTRLGGVQTGRRVLARTSSVALEERTDPLDVTLVSGVAIPLERLDTTGLAWVQGPLHMLVVGGGTAPAWVSLRFRASVPVTVPAQPGVRVRVEPHGVLTVCVPATGRAPLRKSTVTLSFPLAPGIVPAEAYAVPEPPQGVQLTAMHVAGHCLLAP